MKKTIKSKKVVIIDDTKKKQARVKPKKNEKEDKENKEDKEEIEEKPVETEPIEEEEVDDSFGDNENEVDDEDKEIGDDDEEAEAEGDEAEAEVEEVVNDDEEAKDTCIYNFVENNSDDEDGKEMVFDDDGLEVISEVLPPDKRTTKPILFKYERVRLLGDRTQQLTLGAKPMIKNVEGLTPKEIAELEIKENVIPLIIQRPLPNGKKERWYIHELQH
jgi:DNA-directed RNA polymerase subunit K/omega